MTKTSISVQELRKRIAIKAKADPSHRFWGLYTHVWKTNVLEEAYRLVKKNRGAAGVDGKTFEIVEREGVNKLITNLSSELKSGSYRHQALRIVKIPKANGKERTIKIATVKDRVAQCALRLVLEPIFEMDFQDGSFGYRPKRTAHQALSRVKSGIGKYLFDIIDLDLQSYFDTVRHDLLLAKIAKRIDDPLVMKFCKKILKSGGRIGLPQGSIVGPLFANLFLNDLDKMLERAGDVTQNGRYETIRYTRFADDLLVQVSASSHSRRKKWLDKVQFRIEQELSKISLKINREKTRVIHLDKGTPFDFLGFTFRLIKRGSDPFDRIVQCRPQREKRTAFLRDITTLLKRNRFKPIDEVVTIINPRIRGWVNYFRHGNSGTDMSFVRWQIEKKVRKFASRQRAGQHKGCSWSKWSRDEIYGKWGLYNDYRVRYDS